MQRKQDENSFPDKSVANPIGVLIGSRVCVPPGSLCVDVSERIGQILVRLFTGSGCSADYALDGDWAWEKSTHPNSCFDVWWCD